MPVLDDPGIADPLCPACESSQIRADAEQTINDVVSLVLGRPPFDRLAIEDRQELLDNRFAGSAPAPVEGYVQFAAASWQYFGLGTSFSDTYTGNYFAAFATKGSTNTLYARTNISGSTDSVNLGALPSGFHLYEVAPIAGGFQFLVDGNAVATLNHTFPAGTQVHIGVSAEKGSPNPPLQAQWLRVDAFQSGGTFISSVYNAGQTASWGSVSWTGTLPAGTGLVVETSSGNTAMPDSTWSTWKAVSNGDTVASPAARYLRYRVTFVTSDPSVTPTFNSITFSWS